MGLLADGAVLAVAVGNCCINSVFYFHGCTKYNCVRLIVMDSSLSHYGHDTVQFVVGLL